MPVWEGSLERLNCRIEHNWVKAASSSRGSTASVWQGATRIGSGCARCSVWQRGLDVFHAALCWARRRTRTSQTFALKGPCSVGRRRGLDARPLFVACDWKYPQCIKRAIGACAPPARGIAEQITPLPRSCWMSSANAGRCTATETEEVVDELPPAIDAHSRGMI